MNKYYDTVISAVLDEIIYLIDSLRDGIPRAAYATYLDFKGDVAQLKSRDYSAACALLWYGIEDAGFEIESASQLRELACA